ncbi:MAG TPA: hypothetical protein VMV50_00535 [Candidatus Paceibacterota bacterium]|nr:hypothetical protein [Candidatus Paceibacterota bacterium]
MDELVIDDKKYVSSKRAAKMTGYAKDYIGQLCREGRVPARLVGRSWYVLESAIQDHRFGPVAQETELEKAKNAEEREDRPLSSSLGVPRYESMPATPLPTVNVLHEEPVGDVREEPLMQALQEAAPIQDMHEAWESWFARMGGNETEDAPEALETDAVGEHEEIAAEEEPQQEAAGSSQVPIRIVRSEAEEVPQELLPRRSVPEHRQTPVAARRDRSKRTAGATRTIRAISALVAAAVVIIAVLNSGYFDTYIISSKRVSSIAGIYFFNK